MRTQVAAVLGAARRRWQLCAAALIVGLVVAVLGTSSAAAASYITSADIKNQTIHSVDIAAGGVGKSEIRTGAVGSSEIRDGTVGDSDLSSTVQHQLTAGSGYEVVSQTATWNVGYHSVTVNCPDDKVAIGGGVSAHPHPGESPPYVVSTGSYPSDLTPSGSNNETRAGSWTITAEDTYRPAPTTVETFVVCITAPGVG